MIHYLQPPNQHNNRQRVTLSGTVYDLTWRWNARGNRWWLIIADSLGMITYIPIVEGYPLLISVTGTRRPAGELYVFDLTDESGEPGLYDWDRYEITYNDFEDVL